MLCLFFSVCGERDRSVLTGVFPVYLIWRVTLLNVVSLGHSRLASAARASQPSGERLPSQVKLGVAIAPSVLLEALEFRS